MYQRKVEKAEKEVKLVLSNLNLFCYFLIARAGISYSSNKNKHA